MDFHKILTSRLLVTDGAMGTYYREKYGGTSRAPELDNLEAPEGRSTANTSRRARTL